MNTHLPSHWYALVTRHGTREAKGKRKTELVNILEIYAKVKKRNSKKLMLKDFSFGKVKAASTYRLSDHQDRTSYNQDRSS